MNNLHKAKLACQMFEWIKETVPIVNKIGLSLFNDENDVGLLNIETYFIDYIKSLDMLIDALSTYVDGLERECRYE